MVTAIVTTAIAAVLTTATAVTAERTLITAGSVTTPGIRTAPAWPARTCTRTNRSIRTRAPDSTTETTAITASTATRTSTRHSTRMATGPATKRRLTRDSEGQSLVAHKLIAGGRRSSAKLFVGAAGFLARRRRSRSVAPASCRPSREPDSRRDVGATKTKPPEVIPAASLNSNSKVFPIFKSLSFRQVSRRNLLFEAPPASLMPRNRLPFLRSCIEPGIRARQRVLRAWHIDLEITARQPFLRTLLGFLRTLAVDVFPTLRTLRENRNLVRQHFRKSPSHGQMVHLVAIAVADLAHRKLRDQRCVSGQNP